MAYLRKRIVKGIEYWSLVESKRINGKPTQFIIEYFGNTKAFAEKLMDCRNENKLLKSYSHGETYALMKIAEMLGVEQILDDTLKQQTKNGLKRSRSLLLIALQSVCNPGSKSEFKSWIETTSLPYDHEISSKSLLCDHFWKQMDEIEEDDIAKVEDTLMRKIFTLYDFGLEKIALDYTNYFTYISSNNNKCNIARRGRNKQKRHDLRQYSLALITTKESGLPLCSYIYEGNKNDQTAFSEYMRILKQRIPDYDPNKITLIFDGGGNNKNNLKDIETHYICSFSLNSCKNLYEIDLDDYETVSFSGKSVKCYRLTQEVWEVQRECILTFSNSLYLGQIQELNNDIDATVSAIKLYNEQLCNPKSRISKTPESVQSKIESILKKKHMESIFEAKMIENKDSTLNVEYLINLKSKDAVSRKYFGKKLIISDRKDWSTTDILQAYREQDVIEKIFRSTKDDEHFSIRPQYHFTSQKIRVHIFCCLLGLTLATILHKEAVKKGYKGSRNKLLDSLSGIRRCWIKDRNSNKVSYVLEVMNEEESSVWEIVQSINES
jgi:transposase